MAKEFQIYVESVLRHIEWKRARTMIEFDIESHLWELYMGNVRRGLSEHESIKKALSDIGDPDNLGKQLNEVYLPQQSKGLYFVIGVIALCNLYFMLQYGPVTLSVIGNLAFQHTAYLLFFSIGWRLDTRVFSIHSLPLYSGYTVILGAAIIWEYMGITPEISRPIYLLSPLFFAGVVRMSKNNRISVQYLCLLHLIPSGLYFVCGDHWHIIVVSLSCLLIFCYASYKEYYGKKRRAAPVIAFACMILLTILVGSCLLPAYSLINQPEAWFMALDNANRTILVVSAIGHIYLYRWLIRKAKWIHNELGQILSIGIISVLITDHLAHLYTGQIYAGLATYFLLGLLLGIIRDGEVIYDWESSGQ